MRQKWEGLMKNFFTKSAAAISAVVISACAAFSYMPAVSAYEEVKVSFDCFSDDISFVGKTDPANFETKGVTAGYIIIPDGKIDKDGYSFEGWYAAADGNDLFDWNTQIMGNTTVYARWFRKMLTYTVHYVDEDGKLLNND